MAAAATRAVSNKISRAEFERASKQSAILVFPIVYGCKYGAQQPKQQICQESKYYADQGNHDDTEQVIQ